MEMILPRLVRADVRGTTQTIKDSTDILAEAMVELQQEGGIIIDVKYLVVDTGKMDFLILYKKEIATDLGDQQ